MADALEHAADEMSLDRLFANRSKSRQLRVLATNLRHTWDPSSAELQITVVSLSRFELRAGLASLPVSQRIGSIGRASWRELSPGERGWKRPRRPHRAPAKHRRSCDGRPGIGASVPDRCGPVSA